jgi:hypothetical protein
MSLILANVFGAMSGSLIAFFAALILQTVLPDGLPHRAYLLIPLIIGWSIALAILKPRSADIATILDRGLLLGAIEWGFAFPAALAIVLFQSGELETVASANVIAYAIGALMIGGGLTLAGVGLFSGLRYVVLRAGRPARTGATEAETGP